MVVLTENTRLKYMLVKSRQVSKFVLKHIRAIRRRKKRGIVEPSYSSPAWQCNKFKWNTHISSSLSHASQTTDGETPRCFFADRVLIILGTGTFLSAAKSWTQNHFHFLFFIKICYAIPHVHTYYRAIITPYIIRPFWIIALNKPRCY